MENRISPDMFEKYTMIMIITLWKSCYPHEKICFLLNKCSEKPDGKSWTPKIIAQKMSGYTLRELCMKVQKDYLALSSLPKDMVRDCFNKILFNDMDYHLSCV